MVRPSIAAIVSSTNPDSLSVSVWMATWTSYFVGDRQRATRIAPAWSPQSSCTFKPAGARLDLLDQRRLAPTVALAQEADVDRHALGRFEHHLRCSTGPGVAVTPLRCRPPARCRRRTAW